MAFALRLNLLIAVWLSLASCLLADNIYVGPSGSDTRSRSQAGSRSTPVRSLQRAMRLAEPGDTVIALDGRYDGLVYLDKSGRPEAPIRLVSENYHGAKLVGSIQADGLSWIVIDGLDVSNRFDTYFGTKGIRMDGCHHIVVRNCIVHDCLGGGINFDHSEWLLVEWNVVHHNAFWDVGQHSGISVHQPRYLADDNASFSIIIRNNTCYANENKVDSPQWGQPTDGNGIVMDDYRNIGPGGNGVLYARQTLVANNYCFLNGGQGIHCYRANNIFIRNNTCYKNVKSFDFGGEVTVSESWNCFVYNNIMFARDGKNVALQWDSWNAWWDYNLMTNGPLFLVNPGPNTIYENPRFHPYSLRLRYNSPAIGRGITHQGLYPFDVDGQPRVVDGQIDLGAKEFVPWLDN